MRSCNNASDELTRTYISIQPRTEVIGSRCTNLRTGHPVVYNRAYTCTYNCPPRLYTSCPRDIRVCWWHIRPNLRFVCECTVMYMYMYC